MKGDTPNGIAIISMAGNVEQRFYIASLKVCQGHAAEKSASGSFAPRVER